MAESGYLAIADISGYTAFLTGSELEHAQGVLDSLYAVIVARLQSPFVLSNIQGDAFFTYAPDQSIHSAGQIMDALEALYIGFRERLNFLVENTSCQCRACANAANLDMKLVIHHGEYAEQEIAGRRELTGADVILLHRLLKNEVVRQTGVSSYALFTMAAVDELDLPELRGETKPYTAELQEFGKVECRVADFGALWERYRSTNEIVVADEELWFEPVTRHIPASVGLVWEAECNPAIFTVWNTLFTNHRRTLGNASRVYAGAVDHCEHGKEKLALRYVDVRPLKYFTQELALPLDGVSRWTKSFSAVDGGTMLTIRVARPDAPKFLSALVLRTAGHLFTRNRVRQMFQNELGLLNEYFENGELEPTSPEQASEYSVDSRLG